MQASTLPWVPPGTCALVWPSNLKPATLTKSNGSSSSRSRSRSSGGGSSGAERRCHRATCQTSSDSEAEVASTDLEVTALLSLPGSPTAIGQHSDSAGPLSHHDVQISDLAVVGDFLAVAFERQLQGQVAVYSLAQSLQEHDTPGTSTSADPGRQRSDAGEGVGLSLQPVRVIGFGPHFPAEVHLHPEHGACQGSSSSSSSSSSSCGDDGSDNGRDSSELTTAAPPDPCLRVSFSTATQPETTLDLCLACGRNVSQHVEEVGGGYVPEQYDSTTLWALSYDGTRVPVSLAYRRDALRKDGSNPCLLHVYGSYGSRAMLPHFNRLDLALLDRGFVLARAHVRGGGELGCAWHLAGRRQRKYNSALDLLAAADALVAAGYTRHERLAAATRSAGGIAVGAAVNRRPSAFRAALLDVPFLDVLSTMCDPSLPLVVKERRQWGDPLVDRQAWRYIYSYSPYDGLETGWRKAVGAGQEDRLQQRQGRDEEHNIDKPSTNGGAKGESSVKRARTQAKQGNGNSEGSGINCKPSVAFPHLLLTTSMHDTRVPYHEPAKYVAKLRALQAGELPAPDCVPLAADVDGEEQQQQQDRGSAAGAQLGQSSGAAREGICLPLVLLQTSMTGGHGAASAASHRLQDRALKYGFLMWALDAHAPRQP